MRRKKKKTVKKTKTHHNEFHRHIIIKSDIKNCKLGKLDIWKNWP